MVRFANENGIKKVTIQTDNDLENTNKFLKTRGYSPLGKIKETYEIDDITYSMPQILSV